MFGLGRFGLGELIVVLLIVLVVFGPKKLPELGKSLGNAIRQFRGAATDVEKAVEGEEETTPADKT